MPLSPGTRLGSYEILAIVGAGGMGEVYRARDTTLGREVAIKTLPSALAKEPDRLARFEREAKLLAALNHPHIAVVYSLDEHEGTKFLAMELVEGETLDRNLRGPLPVEDALKLALQIAEALEAAHEKGVVHRDLKPANVMVTHAGQVKVLDFGLAKAFSGDPNSTMIANSPALSAAMTQQGFILGTAGYMSPEQASGQPTDQRADVWAFGVVLFEMLTGKPLYSGESVPHVLADVLRTPPDWGRLPKNLHPRLKLLLERCLEKSARNRYHSIADVRVDIERVLADPDGAALPIAAPPMRAGSRWLVAAGSLVAVSAAAVAAWWLKPVPPPEVKRVVRFEFALDEGQSFRALGRDVVAVSPDGANIVYNTNRGLYVRAVDELEGRLIPGTEQPVSNPLFSPDGEWIAYYDFGAGQLKKTRSSGGSAVVLTEASNPQGASWSPDGSKIVFGQPLGLYEVSANGGAPALLIASTGSREFWDPQLLPGGSLLFTRGTVQAPSGANEIVIRAPGGEERVLFPGERAIYTPTGHLIATDPDTTPTVIFARRFDPDTLELGGPVPVVENAAFRTFKTHYAIAPSGTLAYVYGEPTAGAAAPDLRLTLVGRDGNRRPLAAPPRPYRNPRVSPDGSRVAVEIVDAGDADKSSIWIYDLAGDTDIRRLTQVNEGNNLRPMWTPDGERLTFMSDRDGPGSLYWQDADGRGPAERLTTAAEGTFHLPDSWSVDGTLSFAMITGQAFGAGAVTWDLYTRRPDGESAAFYAPETGTVWSSAFSPDGRWLAYTSNEASPSANDFRVFVERYPKTGERYEVAIGPALNPVWSRDGSEIFYRRGIGEDQRVLNSVKILQTEPRFRFTTASSVAIGDFLNHQNYRDFDPLPDGSGWIMLTPANDATASAAPAPPASPDRIRVVLNWFEELERRAPIR
jgi:serine/threonine-protein kinase